MEKFNTPIRKPTANVRPTLNIPPSPFMKKLGYGAGVGVYKFDRSPRGNQICSPWAIKKLLKKSVNNTTFALRLKDEAEILRKLNHPNIIGFRAFIKCADSRECLAMEECTSCLGNMIETLYDTDKTPYDAKTIMKVAYDISLALNYLHNQALLLHGDIKSYNILVQGEFKICKLCDFGVTLPLTIDGEINRDEAGENAEYIGTRIWLAPEVVRFPQVITTKADIFSYGLVLWEMMALGPPNIDTVDSSYCSIESESFEEYAGTTIGTRPALPDFEFDNSYKYVLEIFYCCTEEDPDKRPSALDLTITIPEMGKVLDYSF